LFLRQRHLLGGASDDRQGLPANPRARLGAEWPSDGVTLTPTTVLVDRRGSVAKGSVTAPDVAAWHRLIDKLLADS
jgi:hypothetical protein